MLYYPESNQNLLVMYETGECYCNHKWNLSGETGREIVIEMTSKAFGTGFVSVLKYLKEMAPVRRVTFKGTKVELLELHMCMLT